MQKEHVFVCLFIDLHFLFFRVSSDLSVCMAGFYMSHVLWLNALLVSPCESSFPSEVGHVTPAEPGYSNSGVGEFLIKSILSFATVDRPLCVCWCVSV